MDNSFVIYKAVVPCPMFPRVNPASSCFNSARLRATPLCSPFVFMVLRIAFPQVLCIQIHTNCPGVRGMQRHEGPALERREQANPFSLINLQTLCRRQKSELLCFQANANSFAKHRGGVALLASPGSPAYAVQTHRCGQNRFTAPQVAAYRAGCHNSTLHTTRLAACPCHSPRPAFVGQPPPLLLGVIHGCPH
jgi:hypothetical protein